MNDKLNLILMIDSSGSMKGRGIGAVNDAVLNVIQLVDSFVQGKSMDCAITILDYSNGSSVSIPTPLSEFIWTDAKATGTTSFGKACEALLSYLSNRQTVAARKKDRDLIVLISDGTSTDDYTASFCNLMESSSFQRAERISVSTGRIYDEMILDAFATRSSNVIPADRLEDLQEILLAI